MKKTYDNESKIAAFIDSKGVILKIAPIALEVMIHDNI